MLFVSFLPDPDVNGAMILTTFSVLGLLSTHLFRYYVHKYKIKKHTITTVILKSLVFNSLAGIIIVSSIGILGHLFGWFYSDFSWIFYLASVINVTVMLSIWGLIYFSVHFVEDYKRSEIEKLVWEAAVKDFELKTLKSQLNPHFIFNALNSVRALVDEDPDRAKLAITQLSSIFRYSLRIERVETVTIEEELKTVIDYLELEKVRYEDRLKYQAEIDPSTKRVLIPPMMIQTLVENGIKHGIAKLPQGGELRIAINRINNSLQIIIENSGFFDEDKFNKSEGFGIASTKQRLSLLFNNTAKFTICNKDEFVKVEIIIPIPDTTADNSATQSLSTISVEQSTTLKPLGEN